MRTSLLFAVSAAAAVGAAVGTATAFLVARRSIDAIAASITADTLMAAAAIGAIVVALWSTSRQVTEQKLSEARGREADLLIECVRIGDASIDALIGFVHQLDIAREKSTRITSTELAQSAAVSDAHQRFSKATTAVIYVVSASRRERFPKGVADTPMFEFTKLVNSTHDAFTAVFDLAIMRLPSLADLSQSNEYKVALNHFQLVRLAAANLVAFSFGEEEWNRSIGERSKPPEFLASRPAVPDSSP